MKATTKQGLWIMVIPMLLHFIAGDMLIAAVRPPAALSPSTDSNLSKTSGPDRRWRRGAALPVGGKMSFLPNIQVNSDSGNLTDEREAVVVKADNGTVYAVWVDEDPGYGTQEIRFSRMRNGTTTFENSVKLNDDTGSPYDAYMPDMVIDDSGTIYVTWFDYRDQDCSVAVDSSCNIDIYLDRSTDGGTTWGTDVLVSTDGTGIYPWHFQPSIAVDGISGNIYVSFSDYSRWDWYAGETGDVLVARSTDGGVSFGMPARVDDVASFEQLWSSIAVTPSDGALYVAFHDNRNGDRDVYIARSDDQGLSFNPNVRVNDVTVNDQYEPALDTDSKGHIYVVWRDWRDDPDPATAPYENAIYLARSTDGALSFDTSVRVSDLYSDISSDYDIYPVVSSDDKGRISVSWYDQRDGFSNSYFDQSTDWGKTFSTDIVINDDSQALSHSLPRIDVDDDGNVYGVLTDNRNGNGKSDIFFTQNFLLDIKANSINGPVTIAEGENLTVTATLIPGYYSGTPVDWWMLAEAAGQWFHFDASAGRWKEGQSLTYQGPSFNLDGVDILDTSMLPPNTYNFHFGVDVNTDGLPDLGSGIYDSVGVTVTP